MNQEHLRLDDLDSVSLEAIRTQLMRLEVTYMELANIYREVGLDSAYRTHTPSPETIERAADVAAEIDQRKRRSKILRQRINDILGERALAECAGGPLDQLAAQLGCNG